MSATMDKERLEVREFCTNAAKAIVDDIATGKSNLSREELIDDIEDDCLAQLLVYDKVIPETWKDWGTEVDFIEITVAVFYSDTFRIGAENIPATGFPDGMHINISIPPVKDGKLRPWEELELPLTSEIEISVRHELEHIFQTDFRYFVDKDEYDIINHVNEDVMETSMGEYLTLPDEVSAHIMGFDQVSESRNVLLFHIDVLIGEYLQDRHITKHDAILVRKCWHDWIDRNVQSLAA
jgi:hypothetical protein